MQIVGRLFWRYQVLPRAALILALVTMPLGASFADDGPSSVRVDPIRPTFGFDEPTEIGRFAAVSGRVSVYVGADGHLALAERNYPVIPSMEVRTDKGGRAEIEIGAAYIRLDEGSNLHIGGIDEHGIYLSLERGRADISLYDRGGESYEVWTPGGTVTLLDNATYRIAAGTDVDPARVAAFGGRALLQGSNPLTLASGLELVATAELPPRVSTNAASEDAFDEAAIAQQKALHATPLPDFVPRMPGLAVLSQYGSWHDSPQYGHVWMPTQVEVNWRPYHEGHSVFIKSWGETWCDDAPWGFAPTHYGRWVQVDGRWGWVVDSGPSTRAGPSRRESGSNDAPAEVGRIATVSGTVGFHASPHESWSTAGPNYPVAPDTAVWTGQGSKAEIEVGAAYVQLDERTELDIIDINDHDIILAVPQGRADILLYNRTADERYTVQTPRGSLTLLDNGTYRIVAGTDKDPSRAASFDGRADFKSTNPLTLKSGFEVVASVDDPTQYSVAKTREDAFDKAAIAQQKALHAKPLPDFVPRMPGLGLLADYGTWHDSAQYGHIWIPTQVEAGWAPFRKGHWAIVMPWGYTWCDDAPWGFAPFHYGRWVQVDGSWGWVPVDPAASPFQPAFHPVYAPSLVVFLHDPPPLQIGTPGHVHLPNDDAVGWFALEPGEVFRPWYSATDEYVRDINKLNVNQTALDTIQNSTTKANNAHPTNERALTFMVLDADFEVGLQAALSDGSRGLETMAWFVEDWFLKVRKNAGGYFIDAPPWPTLKMPHPAYASAARYIEPVRIPKQLPPVNLHSTQPPEPVKPARLK